MRLKKLFLVDKICKMYESVSFNVSVAIITLTVLYSSSCLTVEKLSYIDYHN